MAACKSGGDDEGIANDRCEVVAVRIGVNGKYQPTWVCIRMDQTKPAADVPLGLRSLVAPIEGDANVTRTFA